MAALARFGSRLLTFGYTLVMTYGVQKAMCARSIVIYPFWNPRDENSSIHPMAVTISGFRIGISFILSTISLIIFRDFDKPIAVIVPRTVDAMVASIAIVTET